MPVKNSDIAERLREIRDIFNVTAKELAEKITIPVEEYEEYEKGEKDIPVGMLYEICNVFGISLTELLTGKQPKLHIYSVSRKGKYIDLDRHNDYKYQDLAPDFANRKIMPLFVRVDPSVEESSKNMHTHLGQEFHYCLEGSYKILIDKHEVLVGEGDSIYFDSMHPHMMVARNGKEAKILVIVV